MSLGTEKADGKKTKPMKIDKDEIDMRDTNEAGDEETALLLSRHRAADVHSTRWCHDCSSPQEFIVWGLTALRTPVVGDGEGHAERAIS